MTHALDAAELRGAFLAHLCGDHAAAEAAYRRALDHADLTDIARRHLTRLLESEHRWDEACEVARAALAQRPDDAGLRVALGMSLLGLGRYAEGWPLLEARAAISAGRVRPALPYPEWDGGPVRSLTVWDEQGFGDTLQFARFIPDLVAKGVAVTLVVRPELAPLLGNLGAAVIPAVGQMRIPLADAWAMIGSLPYRLGVTLDRLPGRAAYLSPPPERVAKWAGALRPGARLGVVARGKPLHANDAHRSLSAEAAAFLLSLPGAENLMVGETALPLADFADTAAVIAQLDLVISADTAVAHLAGALGKPTWILLPWMGEDWRWLHDGRTDSPWYPSVKLYRQPAPGDWGAVLRAVARDLQVLEA